MIQNEKFEPIEISNFSGGINREVDVTAIADNECYDLVNFFFDTNSNPLVRYGCSKVNTTPSNFNSRITSIFAAYFGSFLSATVVITAGSKIYKETDENTFVDITGSNKIPNDTFWSWKQFDNLLIGCNGGLSSAGQINPVKWDGTTSTIEQLKDGENNAPNAKYAEIFNDRLFLVDALEKNKIHYSKLGDPENFTNGGGAIEIDKDDGDEITGLFAYKKRLFIFKSSKIYIMTPSQTSNNPALASIDIYSPNIGCISYWTIQAVLNDVAFLSEEGLVSLKSADANQEFVLEFLSNKIPDIVKYAKRINNYNKFASVIKRDYLSKEYWLAMPTETSGLNNGVVYILDYKDINKSIIRWLKFDGLTIGASYCKVKKGGFSYIYIGSNDGNVYRYGDENITSDNGATFESKLISKSYNFNDKFNEKEIESVALRVTNTTKNNLNFSIDLAYKFDNSASKSKTLTIDHTETSTGSVWGETTPSIGTWASQSNTEVLFVKKITGDFGRKFIDLQFTITSTTLNQKFTLKGLSINLALLNSRKSGNSQ